MFSLPPEIVGGICAFVEVKDIARLAQTSRVMADLVLPYLWDGVQAEALLALLPCTHVDHHESIGKLGL